MRSPVPVDASTKQGLKAPLAKLKKRGSIDCKTQRIIPFVTRLFLQGISAATPIKSYQRDYLHMSSTRTALDVLTFMEQSSEALESTERSIGNEGMLKEGEVAFLGGEHIGYSIPIVSFEKILANNIYIGSAGCIYVFKNMWV